MARHAGIPLGPALAQAPRVRQSPATVGTSALPNGPLHHARLCPSLHPIAQYTVRQSPHRLSASIWGTCSSSCPSRPASWAGHNARAEADRRDLDRIRHNAIYQGREDGATPASTATACEPLSGAAAGEDSALGLSPSVSVTSTGAAPPGRRRAQQPGRPEDAPFYMAAEGMGRYQALAPGARSVGMVRGRLVYRVRTRPNGFPVPWLPRPPQGLQSCSTSRARASASD
ncbi:hypothetical protein PAPYR_13266 [Paratrimastix pyriformis]|uniref:Uncharacterized protein n=1 Tax=Paratrimastix pyriformis TaxID=342808 RepID=A0ABQ8U0J1_9EUKA|nr:hypothetical protein PAPYR_13266 [Paratrimastix pyriformis]